MKFQKLGKYTLLEKMDVGGMAEIHLAVGSSIGSGVGSGTSSEIVGVSKFFAIKQILTDYSENDEFINMFMEEAKIASQLSHSNIVNIFDFGVDNTNQFYIVMEFVNGRNLKQIIRDLESENRKLPIEFIAYIIKEAAIGLDYAHNAVDSQSGQPLNIIHRDVSPQNIMVSYDGEIKVIDFGIAKSNSVMEDSGSGAIIGKFGYMSPEQACAAEMDSRSDLFSLGVITWELLTNKRLFASETELETLAKIKKGHIPELASYIDSKHTDFADIVKRCLANHKNERYQNGQDLSKAIDFFLTSHFPEFNKHIFSHYLKNTFYQTFEKSQELLLKFGQMKLNTDEFANYSNNSKFEEDLSPVSLPLKNINIKKDLNWIYGFFSVVILLLIYVFSFEMPKHKLTADSGFENPRDINKRKINLFKNFEMPFDNIAEMSAIGNQACIQTQDRKSYCWGDNRFNQLGVSTNKDYVQLLEIKTFPWKTLEVGKLHSCGITNITKGEQNWFALKCWGNNSYGQIGNPTEQNVAFPTTIDPNTEYQAISVGLSHTCGITVTGIAKCWGRGEHLQLGLLNISSSKVPLTVDSNLHFQSIDSGANHTCGLLLDNSIRCWGRNNFGQLGIGENTATSLVQPINSKLKYRQVALGENHSCALSMENDLYCWGKNDFGQLGTGNLETSLTPIQVHGKIKYKKVKLGKFHTCAESVHNELFCWGRNNYFQISNKVMSEIMEPISTAKLSATSDFSLGELSTCFSLPGKLNCRGYHWIDNPRSPAGER